MTTVGWRPGPGDPTLSGWLVFLGYLMGAALCFHASRLERRAVLAGKVRLPGVWTGLSAVLLLLGLNKQLDLHSAITWIGREMAGRQGWYRSRREVQAAMLIALVLAAAVVVSLLFRKLGRRHPRYLAPMVGVSFLTTFVLIRAASFHHVDAFLSRFAGGLKVHSLFELAGIVVITISAIRGIREDRRASG